MGSDRFAIDEGLLPRIVTLAEEAGAILRARLPVAGAAEAPLDVEYKGGRDLVTAADRASEDHILAGLARLAPGVPILSEEQPDPGVRGGPLWIVDPLDGTTNFAHGHPLYTVSIALVVDGVPQLAVTHAPEWTRRGSNGGSTWSAERGRGARGPSGEPLKISPEADLSKALLATGFSYGREELGTGGLDLFAQLLREAREIRRGGSACLDLAFCAEGIFAGFWEADLKPHDVAAGALLIEEAGGMVTDYRGEGDWLFGRSLIAGGAVIHGELLRRIEEHWQFDRETGRG